MPSLPTLLPQIETITKNEQRPRIYLWRDDQWWSFPQLETYNTGEMKTVTITTGDIFGNARETREHQIEKVGLRVRPTYEPPKGPGFDLARNSATPNVTTPADLPTTITGNSMVLEWKRGYEDKTFSAGQFSRIKP